MARHRFIIKTKGKINLQLSVTFPYGAKGVHDADEYVKTRVRLQKNEELWRLSSTGSYEYELTIPWSSDLISRPD